uniref:DUF1618 domain-containing protein n=1 Tax=Oryza punctata TaxID=4537 RepID=A0A0E0MD13_ORYPU
MCLVAVHRGSMLLQMFHNGRLPGIDYFAYNAGAAAAADPPRPPSMSLIPIYRIMSQEEEDRGDPRYWLAPPAAGAPAEGEDHRPPVPRRGRRSRGGASHRGGGRPAGGSGRARCVPLWGVEPERHEATDHPRRQRQGRGAPVVAHRQGRGCPSATGCSALSTYTAAMRHHCVRHVRRGSPPPIRVSSGGGSSTSSTTMANFDIGGFGGNPRKMPTIKHNVRVTSGGDTLKFIDISPRCCCGIPGITLCHNSCGAFVINTWTLRMTWVMDAMVDVTELWTLDTYSGLPHVRPEHPVVSMDNPHQYRRKKLYDGDGSIWKIAFEKKSRTLLSKRRCPYIADKPATARETTVRNSSDEHLKVASSDEILAALE